MSVNKADIIAKLQKDLLSLQGFKIVSGNSAVDVVLGPLKNAFPSKCFPIGAMHEFIYTAAEEAATTAGFIAGVLAALMQGGGVAIWIAASPTIFPPALQSFGVTPDKVIFVDLQKERDMLWAMEEALKCDGLAAVIGEITELSFTASRRLQLAVEQSRVTGFVLRRDPRSLSTTACVTRWKITALPSALTGAMPGIGFPKWNVELLKVRNGRPGSWQLEFRSGRFRHAYKLTAIPGQLQQKTG